jgi:hypothetical protein
VSREDLQWSLDRLRAMSAGEIALRLRRSLRNRFLRGALRSAADRPAALRWEVTEAEWDELTFFFSFTRRSESLSLVDSAWLRATREEAERILEHRIAVFGVERELGPAIRWNADPATGEEIPNVFWTEIRTSQRGDGLDVRRIWELNRHQHLVTLGRAHFLTGDERYAAEAIAEIEDWIEQNPPGWSVNWASALEVSLRLLSWGWTLRYVVRSKAAEGRLPRIWASVAVQARYLLENLSLHSSANNHLIGEAAGLVFLPVAFPFLRLSRDAGETGWRILEREAGRQFAPDGVGREQAFHYAEFSAALLAHAVACRLLVREGETWEGNRLRIPGPVTDALVRATEFLDAAADGGDHAPEVGDADGGRAFRLSSRPAPPLALLREVLTVLTGRGEFKRGDRPGEEATWLLGEEGVRRHRLVPRAEPPRTSLDFDGGGYALFRTDEGGKRDWGLFDAGPLGYLSIAAHGHADALSLLVSRNGRPVLIDPGTYGYHESAALRDYFRSTTAHNTLLLDRLDQSEMRGPFLWRDRAEVTREPMRAAPLLARAIGTVRGYGDGVRRPVHRRTVHHAPGWPWLVLDEVEGAESGLLEAHFHFAPGFEVEATGASSLVVSDGTTRVSLAACGSDRLQLETWRGNESPLLGWCSPAAGVRVPIVTVRLTRRGAYPFRMAWSLDPDAGPWDPAAHALLGPEAGGLLPAKGADHALEERAGDRRTFWVFGQASIATPGGELRSRATVLRAAFHHDRLVEMAALDPTKVTLGEILRLDCADPLDAFSLRHAPGGFEVWMGAEHETLRLPADWSGVPGPDGKPRVTFQALPGPALLGIAG